MVILKSILNMFSNTSLYDKFGIFTRIKDRFKITFLNEQYVKDINLSICDIQMPSNINKKAYNNNIKLALKSFGNKEGYYISPDIYRMYDYHLYNTYQKKLFAFSVVESIRSYLRISNKNISNSCIVIYDAEDKINEYIIDEISKYARYIVLLSKNLSFLNKKREYLMHTYGVTPIITREYNYAFSHSDFIITSRNIELSYNNPVWYIDNSYFPQNRNKVIINDVLYKVPWNINNYNLNTQLVASILSHIGSGNMYKDLKYNGIYMDKFIFKSKP